MEKTTTAEKALAAENLELRERLEAAEEMLRAIRSDEIDALVINQGGTECVRTLDGADEAYRTFVEVMSQGAATVSGDGKILYCNRHFAELLRSPLEHTIGASIFDFAATADEGALRALLWEGLNTTCFGKDFRLRARDGCAISTVVTATPLCPNNIPCVCLVLTDLTEREARIAAEAANRAKDRFLAILSHELRTPLAPIVMTIAGMEMDERLPAEVRADLAMVRRNVDLETRLIDDLLDLSRVVNGKLRLQARPLSVKPLVTNVLEMVCSDVTQKCLDVRCQWNAKTDSVNGDPARLQQLIWNIVKNAIKFSKERGTIDIQLFNADEHNLTVQVSDNGTGIDAALLPSIFNAFEQGNLTGIRQSPGLGLGLTIAKAVVEMHGGTISAHSDGLGKGATIAVTIPVTAEEIPRSSDFPVHESEIGHHSGYRVLLVEDHRETAKVLCKLLQASGHSVRIASSIADALALASTTPFDLIISDIGLPDGTGHDLMLTIKREYQIPGIALTGYGMEDDMIRSREVGFIEHVVKPVDIRQLQAVMRRVVGNHGTNRSRPDHSIPAAANAPLPIA